MMKSVINYKPLDLKSWDSRGQGNNIVKLFKPLEKLIWDKSYRYRDLRDDEGHVEHVTYFAFQLLKYIKGERKKVIPAAILHDTGWGLLFPEIIPEYDPFSEEFKKNDSMYRAFHEIAGVIISNKILGKVKYPEACIPDILEIISKHDTRKDFFSPEDGIMRDADKLWRFTYQQWKVYHSKKVSADVFEKSLLEDLEKIGFFYSDVSKQIAKIELEQTMKYIKNNPSND